jgi:ubiquitin C-terminal hydrolase
VLNNVRQYEAVSIIEYQGSVNTRGESDGHYICDVKEKSEGTWFRTNDNQDPILIKTEDVSKCAYVILYKQVIG